MVENDKMLIYMNILIDVARWTSTEPCNQNLYAKGDAASKMIFTRASTNHTLVSF